MPTPNGRRIISTQYGGSSAETAFDEFGDDGEMIGDYASVEPNNVAIRARTGFNSPNDYAVSQSAMQPGKVIV